MGQTGPPISFKFRKNQLKCSVTRVLGICSLREIVLGERKREILITAGKELDALVVNTISLSYNP